MPCLTTSHGIQACHLTHFKPLQVAELNAKVQELEAQFNAAVDDKNAAIRESERCQLKLTLANRLITALASEGARRRCRTCAAPVPDSFAARLGAPAHA